MVPRLSETAFRLEKLMHLAAKKIFKIIAFLQRVGLECNPETESFVYKLLDLFFDTATPANAPPLSHHATHFSRLNC